MSPAWKNITQAVQWVTTFNNTCVELEYRLQPHQWWALLLKELEPVAVTAASHLGLGKCKVLPGEIAGVSERSVRQSQPDWRAALRIVCNGE